MRFLTNVGEQILTMRVQLNEGQNVFSEEGPGCRCEPTCVPLLPDLQEGPIAMLTLLEDWVSVVLPPSAADSPEMTRPLEKLLLPKSRLRVELEEEIWLERCWPAAWPCELRGPPVERRGTCEKMEAMEVLKDSWLLDRRWTRPWAELEPCWLSRIGPDWLVTGTRCC